MSKKLVALSVIALMSMSLAACGAQEETVKRAAEPPAKQTVKEDVEPPVEQTVDQACARLNANASSADLSVFDSADTPTTEDLTQVKETIHSIGNGVTNKEVKHAWAEFDASFAKFADLLIDVGIDEADSTDMSDERLAELTDAMEQMTDLQTEMEDAATGVTTLCPDFSGDITE